MTFKLMNMINFFELGQGVGHFLTAPVMIFPKLQQEFDVVVRIIGCVMNTFWIADLPVMTLLAFSRILIFTDFIGPRKYEKILKVILSLVLSWLLFVLIYGCIDQNLMLDPPMWMYDFDKKYTYLFNTIELALSFPCLGISYLSYLTIIYVIYSKKKYITSTQSRKNEIAILLQYTFVTIYINVMIILWHPSLFTLISFIDMDRKRNQAILTGLWIVHCYVNPILLLLFNKSIREECIQLIVRGKTAPRVSRINMKPTSTIIQ